MQLRRAVVPLMLLVVANAAACSRHGQDANAGDDVLPSRPPSLAFPVPDGEPPLDEGVHVRVVMPTKGDVHADVAFHDDDGQILATTKTDDEGRAWWDQVPSQVTIATHDGALLTFTNVARGDVLTVSGSGFDVARSLGGLRVTPQTSLGPDARYDVTIGSCAQQGLDPVLVHLRDDCLDNAGAVLVRGHTSEGTFFAWNDRAPIPGWARTEDVSTGQWFPASTATLSADLSAVPLGWRSHIAYAARLGDGRYALSTGPSLNDGDELALPVGFAQAYSTIAELQSFDGTSVLALEETHAAGDLHVVFDQMLPTIGTTHIENTLEGRFSLSWLPRGSTVDVDGGFVTVQLATDGPDSDRFLWTLVVPPGTTEVRTPKLPAHFTSEGLAAYSGTMARIGYVASDGIDGYGHYKRIPTRTTGLQMPAPPLPAKPGMRARTSLRTYVAGL